MGSGISESKGDTEILAGTEGDFDASKFDEKWYLETYPDVARGIRNGVVKSALDHFLKHGQQEGRQPRALQINYVVHIGPHKTATTYLQARLKRLRPKLRELGTLYPETWGLPDGNSAHRVLFERLQTGDSERLQNDFSEAMDSGADTILISSEDLVDLSPNGIALLKKMIGDQNVKIVYYVRRWSSKLVSSWKESLLHGATATFPEYVSQHLSNPLASGAINFTKAIEQYENVFGRENIKLVSYDYLVENKIDFLSHFLKTFLGYDIPNEEGEARIHESADFVDSEIIRILNILDDARRPRKGLGLKFFRVRDRIDAGALRNLLRKTQSSLVLNENAPIWQEVLNTAFNRFGDLLVEPKPKGRFFQSRLNEQRYVNTNYIADPELHSFINDLQRSLEN
jgi:hypothetical protein